MSRRGKQKVPLPPSHNSLMNYWKADKSAEANRFATLILDSIIDQAINNAHNIATDIIQNIINQVTTISNNTSSRETDNNNNGTQLELVKLQKHNVSDKTLTQWKAKFPWLDTIKDQLGKCFLTCVICKEAAKIKKLTSVWAHEGTPNVQFSAVTRHNESQEHLEVLTRKKSNVSENTCTFDSDDDCDTSQSDTLTIIHDDKILFNSIYYVTKSEIPTNSLNGLLDLQKKNGLEFKYTNLSWDTITEIQKCICQKLTDSLVDEIKTSEVYGIMLDESTDIGIQKRLSVCVRYVKQGEPVTKFLLNVQLENGCAITIVNCVLEEFEKLEINLNNCVSLATDGAATMMGKKTGVGVQLKSKYAPFVLQTHCVAHRLNLACVDSIKEKDFLVKFREKFTNLFNFISASANRVHALKEIQSLLHEPELSIKDPHNVRWLGLKNAVEAVFESYSSILATLSKFASEKSAVAKGLYKYYSSYKVVLVTAFMLDVHTELSIFSCSLQKKNLSFSEIIPLMDGTIAKIETMKSSDGEALLEIRKNIEVCDEEDTKRKLNGEKLTFKTTMDAEFLTIRTDYVNSLSKNIKKRLKRNDGELLTNFSKVLEPIHVNAIDNASSFEAVENLSVVYGREKKTKIVEGNLTEGIVERETIVKPLLDEVKLKQEWVRLNAMIKGAYSKLETNQLCKRLILHHKDIMPEFSKLAVIALCLSLTSVECERSFSTQNRLKSRYRASVKADQLDVMMKISMLGPDPKEFNPYQAIRLWANKKKRRRGRLYAEYRPSKKQKLSTTPNC